MECDLGLCVCCFRHLDGIPYEARVWVECLVLSDECLLRVKKCLLRVKKGAGSKCLAQDCLSSSSRRPSKIQKGRGMRAWRYGSSRTLLAVATSS